MVKMGHDIKIYPKHQKQGPKSKNLLKHEQEHEPTLTHDLPLRDW